MRDQRGNQTWEARAVTITEGDHEVAEGSASWMNPLGAAHRALVLMAGERAPPAKDVERIVVTVVRA